MTPSRSREKCYSLGNQPKSKFGFRYLLLEFPCLLNEDPPQRILELGCGCGSSLLPVLKANSSCHVTAIDLSPTAITMLKRAAKAAHIPDNRITAYAADATDSESLKSTVGARIPTHKIWPHDILSSYIPHIEELPVNGLRVWCDQTCEGLHRLRSSSAC